MAEDTARAVPVGDAAVVGDDDGKRAGVVGKPAVGEATETVEVNNSVMAWPCSSGEPASPRYCGAPAAS